MSATADGEDHAYFQAIEASFVRLRGAPFLLSPADWQLARDWHRRGIPLDVVEQALSSTFARRAERGASGKVQSLRYCRHAVEEQWAARRELGVAAGAPGGEALPVARRLAALAAALPEALAEAFAPRLLALAGTAAAVEEALAGLDRQLLGAAEEGLAPEGRRAVAERAQAALARLEPRLPAEEREAVQARLQAQELRRRCRLPHLSLFSLEALAGEES